MSDVANDAVDEQVIEILKDLDVPVDIDPRGAVLTTTAKSIERQVREVYREAGHADEFNPVTIRQGIAAALVRGDVQAGDERTQQMVDAVRSNRVNLAREAVYADYRDGHIDRATFLEAKKILGEPVPDDNGQAANPFYSEY